MARSWDTGPWARPCALPHSVLRAGKLRHVRLRLSPGLPGLASFLLTGAAFQLRL